MTAMLPAVWKDALKLLSVRLVLAQLGLVTGVVVLFLLWLRLPDASILEVAGSGLLALLVAASAGVGESRNDWQRAAYLNSRVPHQLRYLLTFGHIQLLLDWMCSAIKWLGGGVIAADVFTLLASGRPLRAALVALRSASFWISLLIGAIVATLFTAVLMNWTPLHGLWPEMISLGLRLAIAALFDAVIACWLLAILAVCVRRSGPAYAAPAGGPDDSQPRTVEMP